MYHNVKLALLFCCLSSLLAAQEELPVGEVVVPKAKQEQIWEKTVSVAGRFQVQTPGFMVEKVDTMKTPLGEQVYHTYFYQSPDKQSDNLFYMVSYCDYPEGSIHADSTDLIEEFFKVSAEEAAFSISGDLIYSNPYDWKGKPGRIWRVDYLKGEAVIKTRAFLIDNRYYTVQAVMLKDNSLNPSLGKFFNSFYIVDEAASSN